MFRHAQFSRQLVTAAMLLLPALAGVAAENKEARVTQIIREVNLLPSKKEVRPASMNDAVREGEAVRTGDESRSELTFADLTISRLGANSIFSFDKAGRDVQLSSGSILLRVPKDSGGAGIHSSAVTVAVTGTTVILESGRGGKSKLIVLEGGARLSLVKYPKQSQYARAGQMIDVPAGATTVPPPVDVDLNQVLRSHPLITDFRPLPSYPLIVAAAQQQAPVGPVYQGQTVGPSRILPPWLQLNPRPGRGIGVAQPPTNPGKPGRGTSSGAIDAASPPPAAQPSQSPSAAPIGRAAPTRVRAKAKPTPPPIR